MRNDPVSLVLQYNRQLECCQYCTVLRPVFGTDCVFPGSAYPQAQRHPASFIGDVFTAPFPDDRKSDIAARAARSRFRQS